MQRTRDVAVAFFDCYGVFVDNERFIVPLVVDITKELGGGLELADGTEMFLGVNLQACMGKISRHLGSSVSEDFTDSYLRRSIELFQERLQPVSGVDKPLASIRATCAVVSNSLASIVEVMLQRTGLLWYIQDRVYSACDVGYFKPEPHVYFYATERSVSGLLCVAIEDSFSSYPVCRPRKYRCDLVHVRRW